MKFSISVNMERTSPSQSVREVEREALELVQIAEQGGFDMAWSAEHHCIELTIGPNPFLILTRWADHTTRIRLGAGVVVAPYWHPIRAAGEAALTDIYSDGRLEVGFGRGAFPYEFRRMADIEPEEGGAYLREMLPLVKALWAGDVAHAGDKWRFPKSTSVPKPLQQPHPPLWVAARSPDTFDFAIKQGAGIMSTPLSKPFSEVLNLAAKLDEAMAANPGHARPPWLVLRRSCVYERPEDWRFIAEAAVAHSRRFDGLFASAGVVDNGFPQDTSGGSASGVTGDLGLETTRDNQLFGTPDEVIEKLRGYQQAGVDNFLYSANFGLPHEHARRSLELFIERVMPHFRSEPVAPAAARRAAAS